MLLLLIIIIINFFFAAFCFFFFLSSFDHFIIFYAEIVKKEIEMHQSRNKSKMTVLNYPRFKYEV